MKNGKGFIKEYNNDDELLFEGILINEQRNGNGKEYDDDKCIFAGEYKNGKRWNGKGYDKNNKIVYELINGNGNVKEYTNRKLIFEGQYLNGKKNGICKDYNLMCLLEFEGEYHNGQKNGKVT